jgi:hypothetical protein
VVEWGKSRSTTIQKQEDKVGADFHAVTFVGVRLSDVFRVEPYQDQVTKYNPDTGAPYQQTVTKERFFWCDQEIAEPAGDFEDMVRNLCGLEITDTGESARTYGKKGWAAYALDNYVVGRLLSSCEPGDTVASDVSAFEKFHQEVKEKLRKCGYKGQIQLHLVHSVNC